MKTFIFFIITLLILCLVVWRIVPLEPLISRSADSALKKYNCSLVLEGLEKGLFLDFSVKRVFIKSANKELIACEDFKTAFNPLTLSLRFNCSVLEGRMDGKYRISDGLYLRLKGLSLEQLNPDLGIIAKGVINAAVEKNKIDFWSDKISLPDFFFEQSVLPLSMFSKIKGAVFINSDHLLIESVKLEGRTANAILKGKIKEKLLDAIVDFIPYQDELWNGILSNYRIKENLYRIPIKKNLSFLN